MRKAVVRSTNGFVINIIEIKPKAKWQSPDGCYLINAGDGSPGDTWNGEKFVKPEPLPSEPSRDLVAEIDDLQARVEKLEKR